VPDVHSYPVSRLPRAALRQRDASSDLPDPGAEPQATEVVHWWNEKADRTIIDSAFQPGPVITRNLPYVTLRYVESEISETERQEADRAIRRFREESRRRTKTRSGTV
jgi:hypothetical protein